MAENYKQFDKTPIVDTSDVVIKGFKFRVRELALGVAVIVCLVLILVLAAILASTKTGTSDDGPKTAALNGGGSGGWMCSESCLTPACLKTAAHVTELLNASAAKPCDDFHTFACSNFPRIHPLSPVEAELTTSLLIYKENQDKLRRLIEDKTSASLSPYFWETKLKAFFHSCNDHFYKMRLQGTPFLNRVVAPTGGWWALQGDAAWDASAYNFQRHLEKTHVDMWTDAFFTFQVITDWLDWTRKTIQIDLSGIGMPFAYYTDPQFAQEQNNYKNFMRTVSSLLVRDANLNITSAERAYRIETFVNDAYMVEKELATIKQFAEQTQDPHSSDKRLTLAQLNTRSGGAVDFVQLFAYMFDMAPVTRDTPVVVLEQDYVDKFTMWINNMDTQNKSRTLNNYLVWRMAQRYVQDLSWDYVHANREMYVGLTGVAEFLGTWRYCLNKLDTDMQEAVGALYVRDHFSDVNRRAAHVITDHVKKAMSDSLKSVFHWMDPQTRRLAQKKIDDSLIKLGYPDYLMNDNTLNQVYAALSVDPSDYFGNLLSFNRYYKKDWNRRLANHNDRTVWAYPTYSFVAEYYNPWKELIVPAGMLQFPVYDHKSPRYSNFGSMGTIVAKQLVHAIDEIGDFYMLNGSHYGSWWSANTTRMYGGIRKCIVDSYRNKTLGPFQIPGFDEAIRVPINAEYYAPLALGESSGIKLAYKAYQNWASVTGGEKPMPGHLYTNDQMFFISYAQTFCSTRNPYDALTKALRQTDVSEKLRVNSALSQVKEFQQAFKCSASAAMIPPKRCSLY